MSRLPDVIFIGYQKAGSAFLRSYFSYHPNIYWTRNGTFFMSEDFELKKDQYASLIDVDDSLDCVIDMYESLALGYIQDGWGERDLCPNFDLANHFLPEVDEIPKRLQAVVPDAKIVVMIRNQVDWLRSNYLHYINGLPEGKKKFSDFLSTLEGKRITFAGLYHHCLEAYFKAFGKKNVHIILLEQIKTDRLQALQKLCDFLEVPFVDFPKKYWNINKGKSYLQGNLIRMSSVLRIPYSVVRQLSPLVGPLQDKLLSVNSSDVLTSSEKSLIQSFYAVSNYHTAKLTGIALTQYGYPM